MGKANTRSGEKERAVCLFSGGPDSAVAAAIANEEERELFFLTVNYGQKTAKKEIACAQNLAGYFKVKHHKVVDLPFLKEIGGSGITNTTEIVTEENYSREYVPFRNTLFLSLAVAWAESIQANTIFTGSIGGPWNTPDNSPEYYQTFQEVVNIGTITQSKISIRAPFSTKNKVEVIEKGLQFGIPFELTWSCQNNNEIACGRCSNCRDRRRAFAELKKRDRIPYDNVDIV